MGLKLQQVRLAKGWSQPMLAKESGVSVQVIRALERNYRSVDKAQIDTLVNLCYALGCKISDILLDEELCDKMRECEGN